MAGQSGRAAPARVLIVEDEPFVRMVAADELADAGYEVLEAENADEAIAILSAHPVIELILTDVRMPGAMDGIDLARWAYTNLSGVSIIVSSGHRLPSDDELPSGIRFLNKPYMPHALRTIVSQALAASYNQT